MRANMLHVWEENIKSVQFWQRTVKERDDLENHVTRRKLLKCILKKQPVTMWTGINWFRIGQTGRLL